MSFSFGFTNDDFSDDEMVTDAKSTGQAELGQAPISRNSLEQLSSNIAPDHIPQVHSLDSLLSTLLDVRVTFDNFVTPIGGNIIYRRELFDVKHQVMCEDTESKSNDILLGGSEHDLKKNVYEGGFKSWECSYDAVDKLDTLLKDNSLHKFSSFLDLGCGTSLPTAFLLLRKFQTEDKSKVRYVLADFNYDVLRLVSLPNLLIHWASTLPVEKLAELTTVDDVRMNNDEILITSKLISEFKKNLTEYNIELSFISGSWGQQFNQLLEQHPVDFIISSETIYSLDTLPLLAESLVDLLKKNRNLQILIAAKNIYFGVGGSVIGFLDYFNKIKSEETKVEVEEINDSQLKRSIISIG